jgi:hypothetical protein
MGSEKQSHESEHGDLLSGYGDDTPASESIFCRLLIAWVLGEVPLTSQKTSVLSEAFKKVSNALAVCISPTFHTKKFREDRLETTIANSPDPITSPVLSLLMRTPFPKVGRCRHWVACKKPWPRTPKQRPIHADGVHLASKKPTISRGVFSDSAA